MPQNPVVTKIHTLRVKPPVDVVRGFVNHESRSRSDAKSRGLENPQSYISCEKFNRNSHMEVGMQVWTYPEKRMETLGAERWEVKWYEPRDGTTEDDDFDDRYTTHYRAFTARDRAMVFAKKVWDERPLMFGVVEVQKQVVDWFVEEDRVAEWADVGDVETIE